MQLVRTLLFVCSATFLMAPTDNMIVDSEDVYPRWVNAEILDSSWSKLSTSLILKKLESDPAYVGSRGQVDCIFRIDEQGRIENAFISMSASETLARCVKTAVVTSSPLPPPNWLIAKRHALFSIRHGKFNYFSIDRSKDVENRDCFQKMEWRALQKSK
jgi:hypothetical protein